MTPEQIIEMAKQAGIWQPLGLPSDWDSVDYVARPHQLQAFAQLVRNAALEEAALFFDGKAEMSVTYSGTVSAEASANELRSLKS